MKSQSQIVRPIFESLSLSLKLWYWRWKVSVSVSKMRPVYKKSQTQSRQANFGLAHLCPHPHGLLLSRSPIGYRVNIRIQLDCTGNRRMWKWKSFVFSCVQIQQNIQKRYRHIRLVMSRDMQIFHPLSTPEMSIMYNYRGWLKGGTVPLFSKHPRGTVPPYSTHLRGTVPPCSTHHRGTQRNQIFCIRMFHFA